MDGLIKKLVVVAALVVLPLPAVAQETEESASDDAEVMRALDAELERASDEAELTGEEIRAAARKSDTKKREEVIVESTVEYETEPMRLPGADELLSGQAPGASETREEPRVPRAVTKKRTVRREAKPTATLGDSASRSRANGADDPRVVKPMAESREGGQRAWDRPISPDVNVDQNPEMGRPIAASSLKSVKRSEAKALAERRIEHVGTYRARLDTSVRELRSSATFGFEDPTVQRKVQEIADDLASLRVEIENLRKIRSESGNAISDDIEGLNSRLMIAEDRLGEMQQATTGDEFNVASKRFEETLGSIERYRSRLKQHVW